MTIRCMSCDGHTVHSPGEPNFNQASQSGKEAILQCQHHFGIQLTHMTDEVKVSTAERGVLETGETPT